MKNFNYKIIIAGEGGQGVQTIAKILAKGAYQEGYESKYIPNFGVEQRGGVSVSFIQISKKPIVYPKFQYGQIVAIFSDRSVERTWRYINTKTIVIYNSSMVDKKHIQGKRPRPRKLIAVDASMIAQEKFKNMRVVNMIIFGAIIHELGLFSLSKLKKIVESSLGYKYKTQPRLRNLNNRALELGYQKAE